LRCNALEKDNETADQPGVLVTVSAADGLGSTSTLTFTVGVSLQAVNQPPVVTSTPKLRTLVNNLYQYQVTAADPDAQPGLKRGQKLIEKSRER